MFILSQKRSFFICLKHSVKFHFLVSIFFALFLGYSFFSQTISQPIKVYIIIKFS